MNFVVPIQLGAVIHIVTRHFMSPYFAGGLPDGEITPKKGIPLRRLMDRGDTVLAFEIE